MRYAPIAVLALALAAPAGAQEPTLSLRQALELARIHSPLLPVAEGRLQAAAGAARERAAPPNPIVELRQENVASSLMVDRFATVTLPLDLTLQRRALRQAGRAQMSAALADSAALARGVEVEVATLYWRSAVADALHESARTEATAMAEISGFEEVRLREGTVAEGVVMRARLERERARLALARAEAEAQRAHAALAQAIGLPTAALPRVAATPDPAFRLAPALPPLASARESALATRAEMVASRQRVEAARRGVSAAWRGTLPDVGLQLGAMETGGRGAAIVALSFELPLLDRGTATRTRARGELTLAEAELEATRRRVEAEVATALDVYQRLLDACPEETMALAEQGGEVAAVADAAYREGAITLVELLDARRARADARATAATWAAELALARIDLQRALGVPIGEGI